MSGGAGGVGQESMGVERAPLLRRATHTRSRPKRTSIWCTIIGLLQNLGVGANWRGGEGGW